MNMASNSKELGELRHERVPQGPFNVTPFFTQKALGSKVWDVEGKELIDFAGGIGVVNVGHCHPKVVEAIKDQADQYIHTCFHIVMYGPYVELADRLCGLTPGDFPKMAMFANSGAEAVENAVKAARYYTKRPAVICLEHAFHGRTLLGMSLTSKVMPYKFGFGPFAPEIYRMPAPYCYRCSYGATYPGCGMECAHNLENMFVSQVAAESTAAFIAEPVFGEGGFITPPPEYFGIISRICKEHGIMFIADEVQSGMGRTGKMFAMEHYGVAPDIVTSAKSLAAGMPLSAIIGREEVMNASHVGGLGGTYGGNPLCCRAALAVLDLFEEENLLKRAQALGQQVRARLEDMAERFPIIGEVRGLGPMLAIELVKDPKSKEPAGDAAKALTAYCQEQGLVILSCGAYHNVIRFLMPLAIEDEQLEKGLAILDKGLETLDK
jgi:4-aminobutyrate aminotransferase/(S)-3-amino-2-methylpropionate transaminase